MLAIAARTAATRRPTAVTASAPTASPTAIPGLQQRPPAATPASWVGRQTRSYYFDAAHHTALTLKELLRVAPPGSELLGVRPNSELLRDAMHSLVESVCPRLDDDYESRSFFNELLSMHLSGLSANELQALSSLLKASGFDGVATESVWSDAVYEDFGFANGPPGTRQRTLMLPQDWQYLIDHLSETVAASENKLTRGSLPNPAEARFARHTLASASHAWAASDRSLTSLSEICDDVCGALGLSDAPTEVVIAGTQSRASTLDWRGNTLRLEPRIYQALQEAADSRLFTVVLRDMLEAVLARRLFGPHGHPQQLSPANLMLLHRAIDEITAQPPAMPSAAMCDAAARLIAQSPRFGKVQVMPLTGVALGHVWIGNALSVTPDRTQRPTDVGTRYLRSGGRLYPEECTVREWPIRWMTPRENEDLYPPEHAWHITVPVPALKLQQSAAQVAKDWQEQKLPYRFMGTDAGKPSQGCRASVLKAVEQGMDDEARALFTHFNAGLPEPDSPTEVALRMNRFMQWLRQLASLPVQGGA